MEHVNGWCFRGIYKGGQWENDLHVSAHQYVNRLTLSSKYFGMVISRSKSKTRIQGS